MNKTNGIDDNKIVDLDAFRKEKNTLKILQIHVGDYYAHLEMGVYLHCVGITDPMHTKNNETHFVVEDHFGNLVTFCHDDPPPGFVVSSLNEFAAAAMGQEPPEVS